MDDPDLYDTYSQMQRRDAKEFVPYIMSKIGKRRTLEAVLDFGCGNGFNTKNVILPSLAGKGFVKTTKIYAIDVSRKMIEFASIKYHHPNVKYMVADVMKDHCDFPCKFDLILSLYVLHWISDHEKIMKCLHGLLKANGEVGFYYLASAAVFSVYHDMSKSSEWASYLTDVKKFIPRSYFSEDPAKDMKELMTKVGFHVFEAKKSTRSYCFDSLNDFIDNAMAVNPFVHRIPEQLIEAYKRDFHKSFIPFVRHAPSSSNPNAIEVDYTVVLVIAQKHL